MQDAVHEGGAGPVERRARPRATPDRTRARFELRSVLLWLSVRFPNPLHVDSSRKQFGEEKPPQCAVLARQLLSESHACMM